MSSKPIVILVGTMTGTAELVAQEVADALGGVGRSAEIRLMDTVDSHVFDGGGTFLIISSTYGNGDVPDNAQAFFADLESNRPDLSNVDYGIVALGDTTYKATFCHGGLSFDRLLTELGARRTGAPLLCDASSGDLAEDLACPWATAWVELEPSLAA